MEESANTSLDSKTLNKGNDGSKKTGSNMVLDSVADGKEKKDGHQVSVLKEGGVQSSGDRIKKNSESEPALEEGPNKVKKAGGLGEEGKNNGDKEKGKPADSSVPKEVSKSSGKDGDIVSSASKKKDGSSGEDCDSSNKCTDEGNKLVACLRVPGNGMYALSIFLFFIFVMIPAQV